jgi:hypothetical protein
VAQGFFYDNVSDETLPPAHQFLGHPTVGYAEMGRFFFTRPDLDSHNSTNTFASEYSLTPGKLNQKWLKHVCLPASRETAAQFLDTWGHQDSNRGEDNLPFRPTAINGNFYRTDAFDHFRSGVFIETAAVTSPASLLQDFTPHHLLLTPG